MKKLDFVVILIVVIIEIIFIGSLFNVQIGNGERFVKIHVDNDVILSEKLTEELEKKYLILSKNNKVIDIISVDLDYVIPNDLEGYDLVYIYNNGVQVLDADCPDRVVVKMGFTKHSYKSLICIPRGLKISIKELTEDYVIYT